MRTKVHQVSCSLGTVVSLVVSSSPVVVFLVGIHVRKNQQVQQVVDYLGMMIRSLAHYSLT